MKVVITGGGGFLGSQLAQKLLRRGSLTGPSGAVEPIEELVLLDAFFAQPATDPRVRLVTGDISQREVVFAAVGQGAAVSIFHLASMVSGECEERFDDALRVNLNGGRNVFEAARAATGKSRVIFASSIACFGGEDMPEVMTDKPKNVSSNSYGESVAGDFRPPPAPFFQIKRSRRRIFIR